MRGIFADDKESLKKVLAARADAVRIDSLSGLLTFQVPSEPCSQCHRFLDDHRLTWNSAPYVVGLCPLVPEVWDG